MAKHRNDTLDVMKGLAMIFVIFDHSGFGLHPIIDHLEVPVFYIISGFLFKSGIRFPTFAIKKVYSLVIPYIIFSALYIIPYLFKTSDCGFWGHLVNLLVKPANYPLWFIKALFISLFLYYFIDRYLYGKKLYIEIVANLIIASIVTLISYYYNYSEKLLLTGLPQALQALPLIGFGHCGARILKRNNTRDRKSVITDVVIALISLSGSIITAKEGIHLHNGDIGGRALLFYPCTLMCAISFAYMCRLIRWCLPLKYIGVNSISFFGFHAIAIFIVLELVDMPSILLPLSVLLLCYPMTELWKIIHSKIKKMEPERAGSI